jgi:hypothetical protein
MRWWIAWMATVTTCFGQGGNFSGTAFDLQTGRTQVISGTIEQEQPSAHEKLMQTYRGITESSRQSTAEMQAQGARWELENQTRELEKQTRILQGLTGSQPPASRGYVPRSTYAQPPDLAKMQVMILAQRAKSFSPVTRQPRVRQLSQREGHEYKETSTPTNETFIKNLLQGYEGTFTDYAWTMEKKDEQTYLVSCNVSLDGELHGFKFRVNTQVGSCRYEGGTALEKLTQSKP